MRFLSTLILGLLLALPPAEAFSVQQVATITPAWQAPGWTGWTPSSLGVSLKADWNADDHDTARMVDDGSGLISSWTDAVSSLAVTGTGTARPTWASNGLTNANGATYAALTCDGALNALVNTSFGALPTGTTAGEIHALLGQSEVAGTVTNLFAVSYGTSATSASRLFGRTSVSGVNVARVSDGTTALRDGLGVDFSGLHAVGAAWSGTTEYGWIDAHPFATPSSTITSINTGTTRLRLCAGNSSSAGSFYKGGLRRILITTDLSAVSNGATDRDRLTAYLLWSVGQSYLLAYNHPFRRRQP